MDFYPTPQPMDGFSRIMIRGFDQSKKIRTNTGFQSLFGRAETDSITGFVTGGSVTEIEIKRGTKTVAKLKPRGITTGKDLDLESIVDEKSTVIARGFPWTEETAAFKKDEIDRARLFGQSPYAETSFEQKMRQKAFDKYKAMVNRIVRLNEILAAQVILEGKMVAMSDTTDEELIYDMYRNSENSITASVQWSTPATATPFADLDVACDRVAYNGEGNADIAILGHDAWTAFQATTDFLDKADLRRVQYMEIKFGASVPSGYEFMAIAGFSYQGTFKTPKGRLVHFFTYDKTYTDDAGDMQYYMDPKKVIVMDTMARLDKWYGPKATFDDTPADRELTRQYFGVDLGMTPAVPNVEGRGFDYRSLSFDTIRSQRKTALEIRVQQSPLFVSVETDCIAVIENASA